MGTIGRYKVVNWQQKLPGLSLLVLLDWPQILQARSFGILFMVLNYFILVFIAFVVTNFTAGRYETLLIDIQ